MKIYKLGLIALFLFSQVTFAYPQGEENMGKKIDALLLRMTLQEKIGQMNQLSYSNNLEETGAAVKRGEVGSLLNVMTPEDINALQRAAVKGSRLGIPLLIARDVIHGFKTVFPIPLGQAATFDPSVVQEGARVAAVEASSEGIRWTFAPMIDIARDPRWGRMAEGCGEDPYLTSVMGSAMIRGFQGNSMSDPTSIAACAKHFVGYGATEGGRDYNSTFIPERLLRNVYFPPFQAASKAGAATFMTSFNDNDGVPSTGNTFILKQVLRKEWGFDGLVVTDWTSTREMITHGFCLNDKEAAMKAVNAGVDMEMVGGTFREIPQLIKEGKVKMQDIDQAVRNILRIKFRLGLFNNPYVDVKQPSAMYTSEHLDVAERAATESAILLKNNGVLPLKGKVKTVLVTGPMADAPYDQMGTWTFDGEKAHTVTPLAAIKKLYGNQVQVIYEPALAYSRDNKTEGIAKAVDVASHADVVLAFVGEEAILSGEAHCLADLHLQGAQSQLIAALKKTGKPLVMIVMAGRPLTIGSEADASDAVLYSFHPGTEGGPALAKLLFGDAVPSGKTPVTFPKSVGQIPIYYAHHNTGRPATKSETLIKDIPLLAGQTSTGCTSFYLDAGSDPLYPFGYGLSYTTFKYSNIQLSSTKLKKNGTLTVTFNLENTGKYDATEVAQLYVQDKVGSVTRPVKELKRFARITLKAGETQNCKFELPISDLAFYGLDMVNKVEPGDFNLWVSGDSQSGDNYLFTVE